LAIQSNSDTFEQMIGQSCVSARLKATLGRDRVAHAILISGPEGSGKRMLASIYARALLCSADEKPCNVCSQCRKALSGNHADLHVIKPVEEGRDKDKSMLQLQSGTPRLKSKALGVEEARGVQRLIDVRPYEGGRAVVIIDSAQELTPAAQNALLKTLEEPPEHVVFILLAESLSPLLPTVLSRCSVYHMARLTAAQVLEVLIQRGLADHERARNAAAMCDGRPGRALALLQDNDFWTLREKALATLKQVVQSHRLAEAMRFLQDNRNGWEAVLDIWEWAVRDALVSQSGSVAPLIGGSGAAGSVSGLDVFALEKLLLGLLNARRALDSNGIYTVAMDQLLLELSGGAI
jgi:DNA polymerase III subunit delta'